MRLSDTRWCLVPSLAFLLSARISIAAPTAPVNGSVSLTPAQAATFQGALAALAQRGHACLIAEGSPLHLTLPPDKVPAVPDHTPLEAAVKAVADAYDYDEQRTGGVFTLTKRYTDPADMPCVTLEECTTAMENVSALLGLYDHSSHTSDALWDDINGVLGKLTPAQEQAVFGSQGLPVDSLSADQQAAVKDWCLSIAFGGVHGRADVFLSVLRSATATQVGEGRLDLGPRGTVTGFGRRSPDPTGKMEFMPVEDSIWASGGQLHDPSGGPVTSEEADAARARRALTDETLAQAVAALNGRGARFQVLDELAARTVTVAGDASAPPEAVLDGLAAVYGLRVHRRDDGVTELTHPERVTPVDVSGVTEVLLHTLPAPLVRASHLLDKDPQDARLAEIADQMRSIRQQEKRTPTVEKQMMALAGEQTQLMQQKMQATMKPAVREVHRSAVRALRADVEQYPASVKVDGLVPVSAMTAQDRGFYATVYMTEFLGEKGKSLLDPLPAFMTNQDGYVLTAQLYDKQDGRPNPKINLLLQKPQPDGKFSMALGTTQVVYRGTAPLAAPSQAH